MKNWEFTFVVMSLTLLPGCAFDILHLTQKPAVFIPASAGLSRTDFMLKEPLAIPTGSFETTMLNAGTRWHCVGKIEYGSVYSTQDQLVTVEASNIYEAWLVVADQTVTGFYLPVEKTFTPVPHPIRITTEPIPSSSKNTP